MGVCHVAAYLLAGELSVKSVGGEIVPSGRGTPEGRAQAVLQRLVSLELVEAGLNARSRYFLGAV